MNGMENEIQILNMLDAGYHIYLNDSYFDQAATKAEAQSKVLDIKADIAASESGA